MDKVHVIYGSTTGMTEAVAQRIAADFGTTALNVASAGADAFDAELVILGTSTWGCGDPQDDWAATGLPLLEAADWTGRKVAVFGLGDAQGFADTFCDAVADLANKAVEKGATLVGTLPLDAFPGVSSKIVAGDRLLGLALDETNEADKTDARLAAWEEAVRAGL